MSSRSRLIIVAVVVLSFAAGCSAFVAFQSMEPSPDPTLPPAATIFRTETTSPTHAPNPSPTPSLTPTETLEPTKTDSPIPKEREIAFEIGEDLTIQYLRDLEITGSEITFEETLPRNNRYHRHIVSYLSEGYKIFGLLTIPLGDPPQGGHQAIIFNHGYIPPTEYQTIERYEAYVDYLAESGFVVFKIDYRGHGKSEGQPTGSYFSPGYTIDAISALKSLQKLDIVDPQGIGMWGHSMAGNLVLRAMLIEPEIQAGVIWSGAIYSYDDFVKYGISDDTYRPPPTPENQGASDSLRRSRLIFETYGRPDSGVEYWQAVSLTEHIEHLNSPLQIHHAEDDQVVSIHYSLDLVQALQEHDKAYELYTYNGGGHNLISPYFDQAMLRTVAFFRENL
jgi:dipeptidyl aminopeptidase/acylaminoacyl peptidase